MDNKGKLGVGVAVIALFIVMSLGGGSMGDPSWDIPAWIVGVFGGGLALFVAFKKPSKIKQ